ncbi:unnamed protein product [Prorocentrum cordatum]|uniref:DRBM domain-containing protein n=1 Tax=Prorocentrum cordatum TaxID=2364126 RepID=A0ABN9WG26_9DINO|nr:unnamed protein product [Polarella glacialis]
MGATWKPTLLEFYAEVQKDPASSDPSGSPGTSKNSRGPISQLQEYVQEASTAFALPANCSVLQWNLSTRASSANLEFRATVAFILQGVPHHVAGVWRPSKKAAQRDAAERALELYDAPRAEGGGAAEEGRSPLSAVAELRCEQPWFVATAPDDVVFSVPIPGKLAAAARRAPEFGGVQERAAPPAPARPPPPASGALPWPSLTLAAERGVAAGVPMPQRLLPHHAPKALLCAPPGLGAAPAGLDSGAPPGLELGTPPGLELLEDTQSEDTQQEHVELLREFCDEMEWPQPRFCVKAEGDGCLAMVEIVVLGVLHTFSGRLCEDLESAEADVAQRVLWYLRAPGSEDAFEPDEEYAKKAAQLIPGPPKADWVKDGVLKDEVAERKTTVMVVQNRLQQVFSHQVVPGMPVWHWSYERGRRAGLDPKLYRARVTIPLAGRQFVGKWMYDQREAQIDTCSHVIEYIDKECPPRR